MKEPEVEARKLLNFLFVSTLPTPLENICDYLNINLMFLRRGARMDAVYMRGPQGPVIVINDAQHARRKRFSLAHEIGHLLLGHGPVAFKSDIQILRSARHEAHANRFAAELLMPKCLLKKYGFLKPEEICGLCQVSLEAARIRAEQLGWG